MKSDAVYLRVSTDDQDHASQRAEVLKWLAAHSIDPDRIRWYVDTFSGRAISRKDYDRLKADAAAGKVRRVIVFSLDRLGRDMIEGMELVAGWARAGVGIASVTQPVDIAGGPIGLAIAVLLFAFAEIGWEQRSKAQRAGIELARSNGVYKGRKPGSTKAKEPARASELRARGLSPAEIAAAMGVSVRTAFRYLWPGEPARTVARLFLVSRPGASARPLYGVRATDEEAARRIVEGQHPDGRRLVIRPAPAGFAMPDLFILPGAAS